jgi:hypothetical protein
MRQLLTFILHYLGVYLLTSCGSIVPIASVDKGIEDDRLVGAWMAKDSTGLETIKGTVYKFNEKEYFGELHEEKPDSGEIKRDTLRVRVYIIEIKNKRFINAQTIDSVDEDERAYFFYAYSFVEPDKLKLIDLKDVYNFSDSPSLYNFIEKNIENEQFYGESYIFVKQVKTGAKE